MPALIGITTAWSVETWGEMKDQPGGILYNSARYSNAIYQNGGLPVLIAPPVEEHEEPLDEIAESILGRVSALFFSGGGGTRRFTSADMPGLSQQQPVRFYFEKILLQKAWKRKMPVIGACRGHQMMVEALGGKIRVATVTGHQQEDETRTAHPVDIAEGSRLAALTKKERWDVNSMHCQVAEEVPPDFMVSALSPEGYIEAMEVASEVFWMSFQFHPEIMCAFDPAARKVIRAFVNAAADYAKIS
ncbi:MAG TPA: gamma-glutamyl-gamma-aminobutyrate hydrolase family protein [Firmicutes bacterium]|nr:gamma-glutamyl-gamma-aminobutyrate hydrolase family protein [Bacillota bacterium]